MPALVGIMGDVMRLALDTNIAVAGFRGPSGASAKPLGMALGKRFVLVLSAALALECGSVCGNPERGMASGLGRDGVEMIVSAPCSVAGPVAARFPWRPMLRDPGDEMVLEAATDGRADALATFNRGDFGAAPGRFGIGLTGPRQALGRVAP